MPRRSAMPVRFEDDVAERLAAFAASHPGLSLSSAVNLLVDEGLRMVEHPGVVFRDGPSGRRAGLVAGPDVWEVIRAIKSARQAEPKLGEAKLLALVGTNSGLPARLIHIAMRYWAAYPDEVDALVAANERAESRFEAAWLRERDLLAN